MGCCQAKQIKDKDKDQPLLQEHLSNKDNKLNVTTVESTSMKSIEIKERTDSMEPKQDEKNNKNNESIKPKTVRTRHKKQDSKIDIKDLMKFDNFTQKMNAKNELKEKIMINLKIKSMDTQFPMIRIEIDQNLSVYDLKNKIYQESPDRISSLRQRLIHKGRLLKDVRTLKQYNILNEQTLMLVRSRRNKQQKQQQKQQQFNNQRSRAMTLGATNPMLQRSKTPEPQQISQMY